MNLGAGANAASRDQNGQRADSGARADDGPASRIERIARRAYEISQARGGEDGRALDDWLQAEREIDRE
jgi:hypothetical protein